MSRSICFLSLVVSADGPARAAFFDLGATIRAGRLAGDWEIGAGSTSGSTTANGDVFPYYLLAPPFCAACSTYDNPFRLTYAAATNTFSLRINTLPLLPGLYSTVNFNAPGVTPSTAPRLWTVDPGGIWAQATGRPDPTQVTVQNLTLSPGLTILQPLTTTTFDAFHPGLGPGSPGPSVTVSNADPVVFRTAGGSGDWWLDGTIRFMNLRAYNPNGAHRSELQFHFNIRGSDPVPEPWTMLMTGLGLLAIAGLAYHRRERASQSAGGGCGISKASPE